MNFGELETAYSKNEPSLMEDWRTLLGFKSISTDPLYDGACEECAHWLLEKIKSMGFKTELISTKGKPLVYAEYKGDPATPTILFYGHYDVQPPEPLEEWVSGPFEPEIRNGKMYARGASDNKGQVTFVLGALQTLIKNNALKSTVKLVIEGEEESGSGGLAEVASSITSKLKADLLFVSDTSMAPSGAPTITMGLRGISALSAVLKAYPSDLHSGVYGGAIRNPVTELSRMISTLHDESGRVAVEGFYDDLIDHSPKESELAREGGTTDEEYRAFLGSYPTGGESQYSSAERVGFRPTIEVNGLHGGYGGPGSKTIIPAYATVKLSFRLGTGQDPERIIDLIKGHLASLVPEGMKLEFDYIHKGGKAIRVPLDSPWLKRAEWALGQLSKEKVVYRWEGGSIPVIERLLEASGASPIFVGFGLPDDNWHAPNECLALDRFRKGFLFTGLFMGA